MGRRTAEASGMPYLPIVVTKHPIAYLTKDELMERARLMVDEIAYVLTAPREDLQRKYFKPPPDLPRSSVPA